MPQAQTVPQAPNFVRSGSINVRSGSLRYLGLDNNVLSRSAGGYWSITGANVYFLEFNANDVNPSFGPDLRWIGFPVRCLVY